MFGTIPTTVPATAPTADLPVIHDDTPMIPTDTHTISAIVLTIPSIAPTIQYTSPFICTNASDSDTPNTPPSPIQDTSPAEITPSTRPILLVPPRLPRRPAILVLPGQPILVGRPYRDYSALDHFTLDDALRDSSSDSSSMTSSDSHSDISSDSSSRHSSSDHSISDFLCDLLASTSTGLSRKRHRSPTTSVPVASPIHGVLSLVCADLSPPRKRIRYSDSETDFEVSSEEGNVPYVPREIGFGVNVAYAITWKALIKLMTEVEKYIGGLSDNIQWNVIAAKPTRLQDAIRIANNFMDQNLKGYAIKNAENKRRFYNNSRDNHGQQQPFKRQNVNGQNVARAYTVRNNVERKGYVGALPYFNMYRMHHKGSCTRAPVGNQTIVTCYECGRKGHYRSKCPKLRNQNRKNKIGNKTQNNEAKARAYAIGGGGANPDSNIVMGTFLLNNRYASMLFDSGADRSFLSTTFGALLDVIPSTLDISYAVELADGRISKTNVILRGCTLGLLGHPFNIDRMPIELGSFNVIISMDWLAKYHVVIVCDKKIVRIPNRDEVLLVEGDGCNGGSKSKLSIILCTKTQKGCQVYLAQVTAKKTNVKSAENRLKDVPIVRDFPKVFLEDFPGLPPSRQVEFQIDLELKPARQVEFQIDLVPSAASVIIITHNLYRFGQPSNIEELFDKGFIRPSSSPWELQFYSSRRKIDLFRCLQGSKVYFKIDLRFGYHQLRFHEEDIPKTPFRTRYGHYEFQVMPFGLTNTLVVFMDLMNQVCKSYLDKFVIIFIDDILVKPKNKKDHEGDLKLILSLLKKEELFTNALILALPEGSENFVVYYDASHKGLGAVLMHREKVIAYAFLQLKVHEKNNTTHDLEPEAVVFALEM
ncbi:putative reverse transcriptase domain-containing protein [Tanacetum coccineum]